MARTLKNMIVSMAEGFIPLFVYLVLQRFGLTDMNALIISTVVASVWNIILLLIKRSFDVMGMLVLLGLVAGLVVAFLGGSAQLLLLRESLVSSLFGIVALSSLLWPRPLFFYMIRKFRAGNDAQKQAQFNASWQIPAMRNGYRLLSLVWGIATVVELGMRVVMIYTLPVATILALSPIVFNGIMILLGVWSWRYMTGLVRKMRQQQVVAK